MFLSKWVICRFQPLIFQGVNRQALIIPFSLLVQQGCFGLFLACGIHTFLFEMSSRSCMQFQTGHDILWKNKNRRNFTLDHFRFFCFAGILHSSTPWKMNGWNLQPSPMKRKEKWSEPNLHEDSSCSMLIFRGVSETSFQSFWFFHPKKVAQRRYYFPC